MALRECPECGSSVKLENMRRHYANVHPGKDPAEAISEEEHREVQRATRPTRSVTGARRAALILVVIAALIGAGYFGLPYILGFQSSQSFNVVTYCGGEGTVEHYHILLVINVAGVQKEVPADIGLTAAETNPASPCVAGFHALHTHDGSGIIHAELPVAPTKAPTLGDFFTIWGQPLTPSAVWTFSGTVTATMYDSDTHLSTDFSPSPSSIPLYPSPQGPNANPYPIPQSLIWNGAYGDGQSGGTFTGEIVWLNVTS